MKIANNFDARKIASAKNKILFATAFVCIGLLLFWSASLRTFALKHPGIIGVLVAVAGEVYFDWKETIGKHARWKRFFMALLVVSLAYELYEAAETDKQAADAITLAGSANERAANTESNNAVLQGIVRELAHVYGQSSNALVEATNVLQQAKGQLVTVEAKLAEARAMIRPLKERLIDLLNEIDPRFMSVLRSGTTMFRVNMPENQYTRLKLLQSEPGSDAYLSSVRIADPTTTAVGPQGSIFELLIELNPTLAK